MVGWKLKQKVAHRTGCRGTSVFKAVNPSVQSVRLRVRTGRTAYLKGRPGRTGILASVRKTARDGRAGTAGVSQVVESAVRLHVTGGP